MTTDSKHDLKALRRIGKIVALTLHEMRKHVRPGITTGELDVVGRRFLEKKGARSAPQLVYHFPGATCISLNDEAAHGIPGSRVIQAGDMVNIDVSAELDGYFADTAAMTLIPPNTPVQTQLCRCAEKALEMGIAAAQAGVLMNVIGRAVEAQARQCGFSVLRDLNGHGVGRNIHEEPHQVLNHYRPSDRRRLHEGLVITIEPFLTTGARHVTTDPDGWTLRTADGSLSAQYEHTLVITRGRPVVVTAL